MLRSFPLDVTVELCEWRSRLTVKGELDALTAPRLRHAVSDQLWRGRAVELDLSAVDFIDASGLRLLESLRESARDISISACSPAIRRLLSVLDLTDTWLAGAWNHSVDAPSGPVATSRVGAVVR